ncbi:VWA domain-containing protein [bacterium D16-54]|nr:VWA domain-containing protein [bacterium D16-54]RKJ14895.1 VWA domain-containing protein [bacterium D16-56]
MVNMQEPVNETIEEKPSVSKWPIMAALFLGVMMLAGAAGGAFYVRHMRERQAQQEQLEQMLDGASSVNRWMRQLDEQLAAYGLLEEEQGRLKDLSQKAKNLDEEDYVSQIEFLKEAEAFENQVVGRLETEAQTRKNQLKGRDPGYASEEQKNRLQEYADQMETLIEEKKFQEAEALAVQWEDFAEEASVKKTGYQVNIMQYDMSEYPKVRLYLDIRDEATGGTVKELAPHMFYVSEGDAASGNFLNRAVQKAVAMNENERLNLNLLADTSGSMSGQRMESAKSIMRNFLSTVQFNAGDQVKLTQFNSIIDKSGFFSNDLNRLNQTINSYSATGGTKLYDTIIYGVQDVSGQEGAKCVIAFTDGYDEHSYNSPEQVIEIVSRYRIPVFIVRVGDTSSSGRDSILQQIAQASGGDFKNLQQFSTDMNDFYNQIYRQLKEYYVVEYEADSMMDIMQTKQIDVYVQNGDKGGEAVGSTNPGTELFDSLLGSYLRSYIYDMNNHYYDRLREYVDDTVAADDTKSIQWQMKKQVSGGFNNVAAETLMDYSITGIQVLNEDTVHMKTSENYEVIYDEVYGDLLTNGKNISREQLNLLDSRFGDYYFEDWTPLRFWGRVNQQPEYILKRGADGKWRFSQYAGDLGLKAQRQIYDVEIR